jgi:hypothetical protein
MQVLIVYRRNRHRINTVCVTVEITLIAFAGTVPAGEDKYGALAASAFINAFQHGLFDDVIRPFHGLTVIGWTPTAAVDGRVLEIVVQGFRLVGIGDGSGQDAKASKFGVVCDANTADVVTHSSNLPSTTRAVMVFEFGGSGKIPVVVKVIGTPCILYPTVNIRVQ